MDQALKGFVTGNEGAHQNGGDDHQSGEVLHSTQPIGEAAGHSASSEHENDPEGKGGRGIDHTVGVPVALTIPMGMIVVVTVTPVIMRRAGAHRLITSGVSR